MNIPSATDDPRWYARLAGWLFLVSIVAGWFGEMYVHGRLMAPGDAAMTAANLREHGLLFRFGYLGYLLEAVCDIGLTWCLYLLLRPVQRELAQLAVLFRIMSTGSFAIAEFCYYAAASFAQGPAWLADAFSRAQLDAFALLALQLYGTGGAIFMLFYGVAALLFGVLILRSGFLPAWLGGLMALAGAGFVLHNVLAVLAPGQRWMWLLLPMGVSAVAMTVVLLRWAPQDRARLAASTRTSQ